MSNHLENIVSVYATTPRLIGKGSSPILEVENDVYKKLDPDFSKRKLLDRSGPNRLRQGDIVRVENQDGSSFVGVLIAINRRQLASNIVLRTKIGSVAVENRVAVFNSAVKSIDLIRVPAKRWKRSKLYFIRGQNKLDVGDVDAELRKLERRRL